MSAILGVFNSDGARLAPPVLARMMGRMRHRASGTPDVWRASGATIAVARHAWEQELLSSSDVGLAYDGEIIVAADATLYHTAELRRRLARARVRVPGDSPAHLIAAAYRCWGDRCAEHLQGDFAFILWDGESRRVVASRDFNGKRTLHYAQIGGMLIIASTIGGVLAHPACPEEYDHRVLGEVAAGFFATDYATSFRAVQAVGAGHDIKWQPGSSVKCERHWNPPRFEPAGPTSIEEGAEALRDRLTSAVVERLSPRGVTSIWLSGGWDSTAVYAAGMEALRGRGTGRRIEAVSVSYPEGDPGREDELIEEVARFWGTSVEWVRSADIPLLGDVIAGAEHRDDPFSHAFEHWLRALARGSRRVGSHVALDGSGGDQLFQVSLVYLADLLGRGRVMRVAREWREKGMNGTGFRSFFHWAVQPLLPPAVLGLAASLRGRPLSGHLDRPIPSWIDPAFARQAGLAERGRARTASERRESRSSIEARWYLTHPLFAKVFGALGEIALEEGVESRSPLLDQDIIALAASRPPEERSSGRETKRLLRLSMKGLLPESILAPRSKKTGTTDGFFAKTMYAESPRWLEPLIDEPLLGQMGIVSVDAVRQACDRYRRTGAIDIGIGLYFTLQTELWLRTRAGTRESAVAEAQSAGFPAQVGATS